LLELDKAIGLQNLKAIHLNDAKVPLGSRLDRHANLGYGFIGWDKILKVREWAVKNDIFTIIETPDWTLRPQEIGFLKQAAGGDKTWVGAQHQKNFKTHVLKKFANEV